MENQTNKKKLITILKELSKQIPQQSFHRLSVQKHINIPAAKQLTKIGKQLLNKQVNEIVEKQNRIVTQKKINIEQKQYKDMKHKLKLYGKNKFQFVIDKIIRFQKKKQLPLHHIHQIDEEKIMITRQYNNRLSQKVDSIIQAQNIQKAKRQKIKYLQSKNKSPLIERLTTVKSVSSNKNTKKQERFEIKTSCFERKIKYNSLHNLRNETSRQKYKRSSGFSNQFIQQNMNRFSQGNTLEVEESQLKPKQSFFFRLSQEYQGSRKLKRRKVKKNQQ